MGCAKRSAEIPLDNNKKFKFANTDPYVPASNSQSLQVPTLSTVSSFGSALIYGLCLVYDYIALLVSLFRSQPLSSFSSSLEYPSFTCSTPSTAPCTREVSEMDSSSNLLRRSSMTESGGRFCSLFEVLCKVEKKIDQWIKHYILKPMAILVNCALKSPMASYVTVEVLRGLPVSVLLREHAKLCCMTFTEIYHSKISVLMNRSAQRVVSLSQKIDPLLPDAPQAAQSVLNHLTNYVTQKIHTTSKESLWFLRRYSPAFMWNLVDNIMLNAAALARLFCGGLVASQLELCARPPHPQDLVLFEFEGCPKCKTVREVCSILELDCLIYPCPPGNKPKFLSTMVCAVNTYSEKVLNYPTLSENAMVVLPVLIDKSTKMVLRSAESINQYLFEKYGDKCIPPINYYILKSLPSFIWDASLSTVSILRPHGDMGNCRVQALVAEETFHLWGYECSADTKKIRETLTCLEVPYISHTIPPLSMKRTEFTQKYPHNILGFSKKFPLFHNYDKSIVLLGSEEIIPFLNTQLRIGPTTPIF